MAKIGIFGGTFDPIHVGHLRVAEEFAEAMKLEKVLMMVAALPPHRELPSASAKDRLNMVKLAVKGLPKLEASDRELVRRGPSFTLDTIREVREAAGGAMVWMALGGDAYNLIGTWYQPDEVLAQAHLVVLTRPGYTIDLTGPLPGAIADHYRLEDSVYTRANGATLRALKVTPFDLSSSMIRKAIREGRNIHGLVTEEVLQYIMEKNLYRDDGN